MTQRKRNLAAIVGLGDDQIKKVCSLAMGARSRCKPDLPYHLDKSSSHAFFAFPGSWSVNDWFDQKSFGDSAIDLSVFPSLRSVGNDETALVNGSFLLQFKAVLNKPRFIDDVRKAVNEQKQVVFTGHSSGGALAVLVSLWFLEQFLKPGTHRQQTPVCVTFGSPLIGDRVFGHAIRRENWSDYFVHFVMRYDNVPRILLAPISSVEQVLQAICQFYDPKSTQIKLESIAKSQEASFFFGNIMRNASSVASRTACSFMGCTNMLLEAVTNFIELSPYRPFGTYIFCTENGEPVTLKNPDAILQLLFYCLQLGPGEDIPTIAYRSLQEHLVYETELHKSLAKQFIVELEHPEELPLSSEGCNSDEMRSIDMTMNELGLSTRARLCICAAGEFEKQKQRNKDKIEANGSKINEALASLQAYRERKGHDLGYYDAFKLQKQDDDFHANVKRMELAGMWDEIIEMLKRYELPDDFEGTKKWVELGTNYRRLVEPLDIANYYRHLKNEDTGSYMTKGRPKRYRFTQRWLEHEKQKETGYYSESCFWAAVEELCRKTGNGIASKEVEDEVLQLEKEALLKKELLGGDVFLEESTFVKWWKNLPAHNSCIAELMNGEGRKIPIKVLLPYQAISLLFHLLGSLSVVTYLLLLSFFTSMASTTNLDINASFTLSSFKF